MDCGLSAVSILPYGFNQDTNVVHVKARLTLELTGSTEPIEGVTLAGFPGETYVSKIMFALQDDLCRQQAA